MITFNRILVPMDASPLSIKALAAAAGLCVARNTHIEVLHCFSHIPALIGGHEREELVQAAVKEAEKTLEPHVSRFTDIGVNPALAVKEGKPAEVIIEEARRGNFDLIVMGSRGLSDLASLVMGSTTHKVLEHAPCPVLVISDKKPGA